jgi:hypothetical protein
LQRIEQANRNAPVYGSADINIVAPQETVWDVLSDLEAWPTWNGAVRSVSMDGPLAEGSTFTWKSGSTIRSTLRTVEPPGLIAWTGSTLGIKAIHVHRLTASGGRTLVNTEESWEGLVATILRGRLQKKLDQALLPGLEALRLEAERRTKARSAQ